MCVSVFYLVFTELDKHLKFLPVSEMKPKYVIISHHALVTSFGARTCTLVVG